MSGSGCWDRQTCDGVPRVGMTGGDICMTTLVSGCEFNGVSVSLGGVSTCYDGVRVSRCCYDSVTLDVTTWVCLCMLG